ncbi:MAG: 2-oxo acid dehydrogenase subunit E2, partial [Solirubrobacterales bacterium]|nr:2-oxo acid dehydrogenase subunit E2 [Solirubrobacterales bacterium]
MSLKGEIESVEPTRFERAVARRSAEIRATVPDAEFQTVVTLPAALGTQATADPPLAALVLAAAAKALRAVPRLNGAYKDGRYERYSRVNLGVTITGDGLYVIPTIFDSDTKATGELAAELAELKRRAAADELDSAELTGA